MHSKASRGHQTEKHLKAYMLLGTSTMLHFLLAFPLPPPYKEWADSPFPWLHLLPQNYERAATIRKITEEEKIIFPLSTI